MATLLYRVGAWCARKAPAVMVVGLMILALADEQRFVNEEGSVARGIVDFAENPTSMSGAERDQVNSAINGGLPAGVIADYSVEITQDVSGLVGSTEIIGIAPTC